MGDIVLAGSTSGTVTISPPASAGTTTLTLPSTSGTVLTTASTFGGTGPAFSAYKNSASQSVTSSTFTKITFDTELFDTNNNFASSTFTPTVAGYYQINAGMSTSGSGTLSRVILMAYKNGSAYYFMQDLLIANYRYSGSCLIYCNGSTDYIEVYAYLVGTSPMLENGLGGVGYNTWISGFLARGA